MNDNKNTETEQFGTSKNHVFPLKHKGLLLSQSPTLIILNLMNALEFVYNSAVHFPGFWFLVCVLNFRIMQNCYCKMLKTHL